MDARDIRAFTPVFDGLWPAMTESGKRSHPCYFVGAGDARFIGHLAIAKLLGIRYQHVRKVLVDAGITDGLQYRVEVERAPVIVDTAHAPQPVTFDVLTAAGFRKLGEWKKLSDAEFDLDTHAPKDPGVYAFTLDDVIVYAGLTQTGLKTRLDHYRRGNQKQRTSARLKGLIMGQLSQGRAVKVFIAVPPSLDWNGLPVNTAAGLETGLIQMIKPAWNIQGK